MQGSSPGESEEKKSKIKATLTRLKKLYEWIWSEEDLATGIVRRLSSLVRIIDASIRKFILDECRLRAASISYSLVLSLIPILVVGLMLGARSLDREDFFMIANDFIQKFGVQFDLSPVLSVLNELLENANFLTGAGFLVLLFSATSVLRNLEEALNNIWRVKKGRPWISKISGYLVVLFFGPVLIVVGLSTGQSMVKEAAAPELVRFVEAGDKLLVLGGEGSYYTQDDQSGLWKQFTLADKIDYEAQRPPVFFDESTGQVLNQADRVDFLSRIHKPEADASGVGGSVIRDIAVQKDRWWIITQDGDLITYSSESEIYDIRHFSKVRLNLPLDAVFHRILFFNKDRGVIIGAGGLFLETSDGGINWVLRDQKEMTADYNDIQKIGESRYLIVGSRSASLISVDNGMSWHELKSLTRMRGQNRPDFNAIYAGGSRVYVAGDDGTLFYSKNGGRSWKRQETGLGNADFHDVFFFDQKQGLLVGKKGLLRYTKDGGETWRQSPVPYSDHLHAIYYDPAKKVVYVAGENLLILKADSRKLSRFSVMLSLSFWRQAVLALGNVILPFFIIALSFFLIYKIMPYTHVGNRAALAGAGITSLLWVLFLVGFRVYVNFFATGTLLIYGALAAIPFGLLLVYISASIILFGAEVAFFVDNPMLMLVTKRQLSRNKRKIKLWFGLKILYMMYANYDQGKPATRESALAKALNYDYVELYRLLDIFKRHKYIRQVGDKQYAPAVGPKNVLLKELFDEIDLTDFTIPGYDEKSLFMKNVRKRLVLLQENREEILLKLTFADLLGPEKQENTSG